jgi:hypothetical protein
MKLFATLERYSPERVKKITDEIAEIHRTIECLQNVEFETKNMVTILNDNLHKALMIHARESLRTSDIREIYAVYVRTCEEQNIDPHGYFIFRLRAQTLEDITPQPEPE